MSLIALLTSDPKAVNPRRWYVLITGEPDSRKADRIALTAFVEGRRFRPSLPEARAALADLRVGLVCADPSMRRVIQDSGPYELAFSAGGALCLKAEAR